MKEENKISLAFLDRQENRVFGDAVRTIQECDRQAGTVEGMKNEMRSALLGMIKDNADAAIAAIVLDDGIHAILKSEEDKKEAQ